MSTSELNLKSIADLPQITELTDGDYLLTVSGGVGKLLPAGNFSGGGADATVGVGADNGTLVYTSGSYEALVEKINSGKMITVHFIMAEGGAVMLMSPLTYQYDAETGIMAIIFAGDTAAAFLFAPDGTISMMG